jgi:hypothetical protein
MLTMTSQDCLVQWSDPISRSSNARLVDEPAVLSYQKGSTLYDTDATTEDINNSSKTDIEAVCNRTDQIIRAQVQKQAPKRSNF